MTWRPTPAGPPEPRPVAASLDRLAARFGLAPSRVLGVVFTHWEELVGADIAAHANPRSLRGGVLTVVVDHPAWATSLRLLSAELLSRIGEVTGTGQVAEVVVRVEGGGRPAPPTARRRSPLW